MEQWKQINGFDSYYVSESGKVKTKNYNHTGEEKLIKVFENSYGYMAVNLMQNGVRKRKLVHRLVAHSFHSLSEFIGATVNHKDGNKKNNHFSNLEWCTVHENLAHAHKTGLVKYANGETHYKAKLSSYQIKQIKDCITMGIKGKKIASDFGVSEKYISAIKTKRSRKHE